MVVFPDAAFHPHKNAITIAIPDDPNRFIGALSTHGENSLPILASVAADAKDVNVPFMTWVPPCCAHLFLGHHLVPRAAAVTGIMAVENSGTLAQAQVFVGWLMVLMHPGNATSLMPLISFTMDMADPVGDH